MKIHLKQIYMLSAENVAFFLSRSELDYKFLKV